MLVQTGRVCVEGENGVGCQERLLSRADLAYNACWNCWVAVSVTVFSQGPGRPIHVFVSGDELLHSLLSQLNCLWVGARLIDRPYYILARGIHLWKMLSILLEVSQKPAWNPNSYSSRSVSKRKASKVIRCGEHACTLPKRWLTYMRQHWKGTQGCMA